MRQWAHDPSHRLPTRGIRWMERDYCTGLCRADESLYLGSYMCSNLSAAGNQQEQEVT